MGNENDHTNTCLSCGADISTKRSDARYCSDRCRMRYRRAAEKRELIDEILKVCAQIPGQSLQVSNIEPDIWHSDEETGSLILLSREDLQNLSNKRLARLLELKKAKLRDRNLQLLARNLQNVFKKLFR